MTTLLHSADWQLGKPFGRIAHDDKRARARRARFEAIERLGEVARARAVDFVVVAGDLFDMEQPSRGLVHQACRAIAAIDRPVYVIPGNHDSGAPGSVWHREDFRRISRDAAPNLRVLLEPEPVLAHGAILLPCPLTRRHTASDPGAWMSPRALEGFDASLPVVVLAHGSVTRFTDSEAHMNTLDVDAWREAVGFDYLALGDWHGTKRIADDVWYAGTPEQERFRAEDYDAGNVLVVRLAKRGDAPSVEKVRTGVLAWHAPEARVLSDDASFDALREDVEALLSGIDEDVLKLTLRGALSLATAQRLAAWLDDLAARVVHLVCENEVVEAPSDEDLAELASGSEPLVAAVARRLEEALTQEGEQAEIARRALRILFHARRQVADAEARR